MTKISLGKTARKLDRAPSVLVGYLPRHQLGLSTQAGPCPRVGLDGHLGSFNGCPRAAIDDVEDQRPVVRVLVWRGSGLRRAWVSREQRADRYRNLAARPRRQGVPRLTDRTVAAIIFGQARCAALSHDSARETTVAETPSAAEVAWPAANAVAALTVVTAQPDDGDIDFASGGRTAGRLTRGGSAGREAVPSPGAIGSEAYASDRTEPARGLLVRETFEIAEHEGRAVTFGQTLDLLVETLEILGGS